MKKAISLSLTVFALLLAIYLSLGYVAKHDLGLIYSSDIISVPYLYKDLFFHGGSMSQWFFVPTMGFFPDFFAYFILASVVGNAKIAIAFFAAYQFLLYFILVLYLGYIATRDKEGSYQFFCLSAILTFLLYCSGHLQQNIFYAPAISGHFGTACMVLLGVLLINNSFITEGKKQIINLSLLGLVCFLTVFSDLLFITQFVVVAITTLFVLSFLFEPKRRITCFLNIVVVSVSSGLSFLLYKYALPILGWHIHYDGKILRRMSPDKLWYATEKFFHKLGVFFQHDPILVLLLIAFFVTSFIHGGKLFWARYKERQFILHKDELFTFTTTFLFYSIIIGFLSEIFLDNVLMSSDPSLRSFQPFILFPIFVGIPLYLVKFTQMGRLIKQYYLSILLAIVFCLLVFVPSYSIKKLVHFYPPQVKCLDYYAKVDHLKNGVGQYWDAKLYSFLSKDNVNVVAVSPQGSHALLKPYWWYDTKNSYINKSFTFVLFDNIPHDPITKKQILDTYGKPSKVLMCQKKFKTPMEIFVYPKKVITKNWNVAQYKFKS